MEDQAATPLQEPDELVDVDDAEVDVFVVEVLVVLNVLVVVMALVVLVVLDLDVVILEEVVVVSGGVVKLDISRTVSLGGIPEHDTTERRVFATRLEGDVD